MIQSHKILKYQQDGTARDTYIANDNGGYYPKQKQTVLLKDPGIFNKRFISKTNYSKYLRPRRYYNNGTGRDSYIYNDDGGFCPGSLKTNFLKNLRLNTISVIPRNRGYNNKKDMWKAFTLNMKQKLESTKLSIPKYFQQTSINPQFDYQNSSNYQQRQTTKGGFKISRAKTQKSEYRTTKKSNNKN